MFSGKHPIDSIYSHYQDDDGKDIRAIDSQPCWELESISYISFIDEVLPSPALLHCAEEYEGHASKRENQVGDKEVLKIKNTGSFAERLES